MYNEVVKNLNKRKSSKIHMEIKNESIFYL